MTLVFGEELRRVGRENNATAGFVCPADVRAAFNFDDIDIDVPIGELLVILANDEVGGMRVTAIFWFFADVFQGSCRMVNSSRTIGVAKVSVCVTLDSASNSCTIATLWSATAVSLCWPQSALH